MSFGVPFVVTDCRYSKWSPKIVLLTPILPSTVSAAGVNSMTPVRVLELDVHVVRRARDAVELVDEVHVPRPAAQLAVGDRLQAQVLLEAHDVLGSRRPRRRAARRRRSCRPCGPRGPGGAPAGAAGCRRGRRGTGARCVRTRGLLQAGQGRAGRYRGSYTHRASRWAARRPRRCWTGTRPRPRPALAAHPRSVRDPRLRGHAAADAGRARRAALPRVARRAGPARGRSRRRPRRDVLREWVGLGYNRRALRLRDACVVVARDGLAADGRRAARPARAWGRTRRRRSRRSRSASRSRRST